MPSFSRPALWGANFLRLGLRAPGHQQQVVLAWPQGSGGPEDASPHRQVVLSQDPALRFDSTVRATCTFGPHPGLFLLKADPLREEPVRGTICASVLSSRGSCACMQFLRCQDWGAIPRPHTILFLFFLNCLCIKRRHSWVQNVAAKSRWCVAVKCDKLWY